MKPSSESGATPDEITCEMDESADVLLALAVANPVQLTSREVRRYQCDTLDAPALAALLRQCITAKVPAVLTGCVAHWPALRRWDDVYLRRVLSDAPVHVAQTPDGLADAIATLPSGERVFAKPFETVMPFSIFACELCSPLMDKDGVQRRPVLYASHQNSSLSDEYRPLWDDLDLSLEWADEAFGKKPAAVNFWMGEDAARTSVHADLFDNLYVVVRGEKCFTLLPPQEGQLLRREPVRAATYVPVPNSRGKSPSVGLELQVDDDAEAVVYWATVALDSEDAAPLQPMRAVLGPGELLVLPSLWWHHVSQRARSDDGGRCSATIAVNYWYEG